MDKVNLAIIYYSAYGTNYQLAKWAEEGGKAAGANVKVLKVEETLPETVVNRDDGMKANAEATKDIPIADHDVLEWADAIVFSMPTRFGVMSTQMKNYIDRQGGLWAEGKLMNKVVSAMTSAQNTHGGQEATLHSFYVVMMHWGAIIAAPGFTDQSIFAAGGNPYGVSVTQGQDGKIVEGAEEVKAAIAHQVKRTAEIASWIKKGKQ